MNQDTILRENYIDHYVRGSLPAEVEKDFEEYMMAHAWLQREVATSFSLRQGLHSRAARVFNGWKGLSVVATAAAVALGSLVFFQGGGTEAIVASRAYGLMGTARGEDESMLISDHSGALSLIVPLGRCSAVDYLELNGPRGSTQHEVSAPAVEEFVLTLAKPSPGDYRVEIHYADAKCATEHRAFTVASGF